MVLCQKGEPLMKGTPSPRGAPNYGWGIMVAQAMPPAAPH